MWLDLWVDFLIVGAGQLGSRHAQAIARLPGARSITFVDPNPESLATAAERVKQVSELIEVRTLLELIDPIGDVFLAVIATSSMARPDAIEATRKFSTPRNLLLEKLLAPNSKGLARISHELQGFKVPTFVNCPMPFFDHYLELEGILNTPHFDSPREYNVQSNSVGLVTNSIHYLDHFWRISRKSAVAKVEFDSESMLADSKRAGYSELLGAMSARTVAGDKLHVQFLPDGGTPSLKIEIKAAEIRHLFDEIGGVWETWLGGKLVSRKGIETPNQSMLTNTSVEKLLIGRPPHWSPLEESMELHSHLLRALHPRFENEFFT